MTYAVIGDLPEEYRIALDATHQSLSAEIEWTNHVYACANAGPCAGCGRTVDVSGSPDDRLCGGCIELGC